MAGQVTLLDIRGLMLRDYHACSITSVTDEDGKPITAWQDGLAVFVERTLLPLVQARTPLQDVYACWDAGNTYRLERFPAYKKVRYAKEQSKVTREQLGQLKAKLQRLLAYLGVKNVHVPGEEADDLIALLATKLDASSVLIHTNDRDLLQLSSPRVIVQTYDTLYLNGGTELFKDFVPFSLVALFKALVGDSSDGYPGIAGLGPKGFRKLLDAYQEDGLLEIQAAIESNNWKPVQDAFEATQDPRLHKILQHWSDARLYLDLAKLHPEACYGSYNGEPKRPVWHVRVPDRGAVLEILTEIGIPSAIQFFDHLFPTETLLTLDRHEELATLAEEIVNSPICAWDYESSDKLRHEPFKEAARDGKSFVDVLSQEVAGISINFGTHMEKTIYVPFDHADTNNFPKEWLAWLLDVIDQRRDRSVVHNANFELALSQTNLSKTLRAPYDTSILSSYADENLESHLKGLSWEYLHYRQMTYKEVTQGRSMHEMTGAEVLSYGCDDSLVTAHLFSLFRTIMQLEGSWDFYVQNEVDPAVNDVLDFIDGQEIDYPTLAEVTAESLRSIEDNTRKLRGLLAEHAEDADEQTVYQRALTLFAEWLMPLEPKLLGNPAKLEELRARLWTKAWNSCFYTHYREETQPAEPFAPTKTILNKVLGLIDAEAPKLDRVTAPGIEEFEAAMSDYLRAKPVGCCPELELFVDRLFRARKDLTPAKRSGPSYAMLQELCDEVLSRATTGKTIKQGDELNMGSAPQMQALLYGKLGLPIRKRSKVTQGSLRDKLKLPGAPATGLKAVAAAFVYDISEADWRADALKAYKEVVTENQAQSLFYRPYPLWAHPRDGRIHPQIRNCGTATRRPSGTAPNVLQVAKRGPLRKCFRAGDYGDGERVVVSADFSNQEIVYLACESRDPVLLGAFSSTPRRDIHSVTASSFAHMLFPRLGFPELGRPVSYEEFMALRHDQGEVGKEANVIRNKYGKGANFLMAYLGGYSTLASNLLIPKELAKDIMNATFALYAGLQPWQNQMIELARKQGYLETCFGTRRHATKDLYSSDEGLRKRQERQMVNFLMQGGSADLLKRVRQDFVDRDMRNRYRMRAVKPVYDEITASVPVELALDYCLELKEVMEITPPGYPVGMQTEFSIGRAWGGQIEAEGTTKEALEKALEKALS